MNKKTPLRATSTNRRLVDSVVKTSEPGQSRNLFGETWAGTMDLLCFSHLRWDFVFQRPQHIMTRFAKSRRVYFFEEPILESGVTPRLEARAKADRLCVVTPHLPTGLQPAQQHVTLQHLLDAFLMAERVVDHVAWYYTPMALGFTRQLHPRAIVYDCMDELSAFKGAPASLLDHESELLHRSDVVFTGGQSLYEAKKNRHANAHAFPSSIDRAHFAQALAPLPDPEDQKAIPHPRIGFAGVIDERMDIALLDGMARARPDWQFVMIGPVVKIAHSDLPNHPNIHYLGSKSYSDLPAYLAGWDAAMLPFARNESTRYISPTKTPEYLAAGRPVVSTSIRDVIRPYGDKGLVRIADEPQDFVDALAHAMADNAGNEKRRQDADQFLATISWDKTWSEMQKLIIDSVWLRMNRRRMVVGQPAPKERRRNVTLQDGKLVRFVDRRLMGSAKRRRVE